MSAFIDILFFLSLLLVVYPYVVYPALMGIIGKLWPPSPPQGSELPSVSVVVAAYNEAEWIGRKIESTLGQEYPEDRLEVIVISDGSTDRTGEIVADFQDPRVKLLVHNERRGKSVALNLGVEGAKGEILVFTDANALFAPGAIRGLAEHFFDPKVGLVSGQGLYGEMDNPTARSVANGYVRLEALIKTGESALGFVGGADGAIYALRRGLYQELTSTQVNDLLHPLAAALAGYTSHFDGRAYTVEPPSKGAGQEFQRHVRIVAQGFAILFESLPQLLSQARWKELWVLCSHRLFRWVSLLGLLGLFTASFLHQGALSAIVLATQGLFYSAALGGWVSQQVGLQLRIFSAPYYFCVMSAAGLLGFLRFLQGGTQATWSVRGEHSVLSD